MIIVSEEICKGCGLCVTFCPVKGLLFLDANKVNAKGWNPVACADQAKCTSCAMCALMCPDTAIEVYR